MSYTGGSKLANKFIAKYKDEGLLLDIYSDEWASKFESIDGLNPSDFKNYQDKFGSEFKNHMLLIMCDRESGAKTLVNDLVNVYPRFKAQLIDRDKDIYFEPSFVLINLATKKMLTVGLGRNANLFMVDVETNQSVSLNNPNDISAQALFGGQDTSYLKEFLRLDHSGLIYAFLSNVYELGKSIYIQENELTGYQYEELCMAEINEDGEFEVDGDMYSQEERDELISSYENYESVISDRKRYITQFFPSMEFSFAYDH